MIEIQDESWIGPAGGDLEKHRQPERRSAWPVSRRDPARGGVSPLLH
jgi:hypothetical protein